MTMGTSVNNRVQKRRDALRAQGLRPVQIWLPDTRDPKVRAAFAEAARRINEADRRDSWIYDLMDQTLRETFADIDKLEHEAKQQRKEPK
jgi:hypothetical protein